MLAVTPYPYQAKCIAATEAGWEHHSKQLIVIPTGGGKTIIFSLLAHARHVTSRKTLILAHREELIDQAIQKLYRATGVVAGKEKAEWSARHSDTVVVASVQSMIRRLDRWPYDHFDLIVVDEAHHALSDSYRKVLSHFDVVSDVLGVTATPDRGDKRNLGEYFENVPCEVGLFDLIRDGFLSKIKIKTMPIKIDISGVASVAGDYKADELGHALEPYLEQIAQAIMAEAAFKRTLVFLPLIATSQKFVAICNDIGLTARHVDGVSEDRGEILTAFAAGEFELLSNAMLLTEGYDDPGIECIVVLRPTRSRALYSQMVGRGTRIAEHKKSMLLLDFLWNHEKLNLVRPAHLVAKSEDEAQSITKLAEAKAGGERQEELDLEGLASDAQAEREKKLMKQLHEHRHRKGGLIDAAEYCLRMGDTEAAEFEPAMKWEREGISEKQAALLRRYKIDPESAKGKGHASKIIDLIFRNQRITLASEAQRSRMKQMGHPNWETATQADARAFFAGLRGRAA